MFPKIRPTDSPLPNVNLWSTTHLRKYTCYLDLPKNYWQKYLHYDVDAFCNVTSSRVYKGGIVYHHTLVNSPLNYQHYNHETGEYNPFIDVFVDNAFFLDVAPWTIRDKWFIVDYIQSGIPYYIFLYKINRSINAVKNCNLLLLKQIFLCSWNVYL